MTYSPAGTECGGKNQGREEAIDNDKDDATPQHIEDWGNTVTTNNQE